MFKNINIIKVAEQIFLRPTKEHSIRELAKLTKLSPATVSKIVKQLESEGIIQSRTIAKSKLIKADIENQNYRFYKKLHNIASLKTLIDALNRKRPRAIILFGSYSRGEDTEQSDIDLTIISNKFKIDLEPYQKQLNRKIQLFFFPTEEKIPENLKQNIINGIILAGSILC